MYTQANYFKTFSVNCVCVISSHDLNFSFIFTMTTATRSEVFAPFLFSDVAVNFLLFYVYSLSDATPLIGYSNLTLELTK